MGLYLKIEDGTLGEEVVINSKDDKALAEAVSGLVKLIGSDKSNENTVYIGFD